MSKKNKVLVVVDMQNDFITGPLGTEEAKAIVPKVCHLIETTDQSTQVITTQDTHFDADAASEYYPVCGSFAEDYKYTQEGRKLPIYHCVLGTVGHKIEKTVEAALPQDTKRVEKFTFGYKDWDKELSRDVNEVMLCGLCTDICVIANAVIIKTVRPEATVKVTADCCAGVTPERHQTALNAMKALQIEII